MKFALVLASLVALVAAAPVQNENADVVERSPAAPTAVVRRQVNHEELAGTAGSHDTFCPPEVCY